MGVYRYGFNGKENDNEVKGDGNQQDYGFRIYDPRAGRFLSVDPLAPKYPELTPYQFSSNRPIDGIDLDGLEFLVAGYLVDEISKGFAMLGFPRAAGFTETYGHGLLFDPVYSTHHFIKTAKAGDVVGTVQQVDPTGVTNLPNVYRTGKAALNGDPYAQGQVLGMATIVYGAGKAARSVKASGPTETNATVSSKIGRNYENYGAEYLDDGVRVGEQPFSEGANLKNYALSRQVLSDFPINYKFKEAWTHDGVKYEVRAHAIDDGAPTGSNSRNGPIFRVGRILPIPPGQTQGPGQEWFNYRSGAWHKEKDLKVGNPPEAMNDTHIPIKR